MKLKKTLFGYYRAKEVDDTIESLEEGFYNEIQKKNDKIESLRKKLDSMREKEKEIGEAVVYAKSLIISAHKSAEQEAKEVLEKAQKDYLDIRESILEEIDILTKKRIEAERLYQLQREKIKNLLNQVDDFLDDENLNEESEVITPIDDSFEVDNEATPNEQENQSLFEKKEETPNTSVSQIEVVKIENIVAKTGTDNSTPVNYFISSDKDIVKEDNIKEDNSKEEQAVENTKHLSRVEEDIFL
ncbi:hypothetical protein [Streptococcus oralis]|uniref:hypothetical protein n=1 Tax=Streptococcus oralis TaxID=1303 RepID=UPI001CC08BA0|nr:hypothetical protein [Streptococcus oralis]MBZ2095722.1 hypothetical protein [Streptococcus oralis]MBZ2100928.1 hypothetical protein [Streptococcus oralis]